MNERARDSTYTAQSVIKMNLALDLLLTQEQKTILELSMLDPNIIQKYNSKNLHNSDLSNQQNQMVTNTEHSSTTRMSQFASNTKVHPLPVQESSSILENQIQFNSSRNIQKKSRRLASRTMKQRNMPFYRYASPGTTRMVSNSSRNLVPTRRSLRKIKFNS